MDDDADGSFNGQGYTIDQRMGNADGLDGERAEGEFVAGLDFDEGGFVELVMLFELALDIGQGEFRGVDGDF